MSLGGGRPPSPRPITDMDMDMDIEEECGGSPGDERAELEFGKELLGRSASIDCCGCWAVLLGRDCDLRKRPAMGSMLPAAEAGPDPGIVIAMGIGMGMGIGMDAPPSAGEASPEELPDDDSSDIGLKYWPRALSNDPLPLLLAFGPLPLSCWSPPPPPPPPPPLPPPPPI